jgi:hypothetical protein
MTAAILFQGFGGLDSDSFTGGAPDSSCAGATVSAFDSSMVVAWLMIRSFVNHDSGTSETTTLPGLAAAVVFPKHAQTPPGKSSS